MRSVDDTRAPDHARRAVFGKSITRPPKPRARHLEPVPPLPIRSVLFALVALFAAVYALARHYSRAELGSTPAASPTEIREVPAPELLPLDK